jgi:putative sigma-54 modulation protein
MVKKQCKTFEEAIELSAESLENVVKRKEKINTHLIENFFKNVLIER